MFNSQPKRIVLKTVVIALGILAVHASAANIKIACVQMKLYKNVATNRDNIISHIQSEAAQGTRVVVFCECALSDYSMSFIQTISESTLNAAIAQIASACDTNDVYAIVGSPYFDGGTRYNAALVIDPDGQIIYRQYKVHAENPTMADGLKPAIFSIDGISASLFICHDERYNELMRLGVYAGAKIAFYIAFEQYTGQPGWKDFNYKCQIVGRAIENQTWTVSCNAPTGNESGDSPGHSRFIGPDGTIHAEAGYTETVIRHTFDPDSSSNEWALSGAETPLLSEFWEEGLRILQEKNPGYFPTVTADPNLHEDVGKLGSSANKNLSIALVQMKMTSSIATNATSVCSFIQSQASAGARVVVFPECALTDRDPSALPTVNQNDIDVALAQVAAQCATSDVYAIIGSPFRENGNLYNGAFVIDPEGNIIKRHAQIHTDLPAVFDEGEKMSLFKIDDVVCTVVVGHDIHFPEFYRIANLAGAQLCFWISYEDVSTPVDNSRFMAVCRAVENLTLSIFCNAGTGNDAGDSTGHSLIANKNGSIYVEADSVSDTAVRYTVDSSETSHSYAQRAFDHPTFTTFWQEGLDVIRLNNPEFYGDGIVDLDNLKIVINNWLATGDSAQDYSANLMGWWKFDQSSGGTVPDSSVNSNTGTLYNMDDSDWVDGYSINALDFDGSNDYVRVPDSSSISVGNGDFTLAAWIYPYSISGYRTILAKVHDTMYKEYSLSLYNGKIFFEIEQGANDGNAETIDAMVTTNEWQHIMAAYDASTQEVFIYYNGKPQNFTSTIGGPSNQTNDDLFIGMRGGSYFNQHFSGKIDEVEIYNCLALPSSLSPGDLNKDGIVSLHDFAFLAANWLKFVFAD